MYDKKNKSRQDKVHPKIQILFTDQKHSGTTHNKISSDRLRAHIKQGYDQAKLWVRKHNVIRKQNPKNRTCIQIELHVQKDKFQYADNTKIKGHIVK